MALSSQSQITPSFDSLPPELQQDIFCYLDGDNASLFAVVRVSKAYHNLCIDRLWRNSAQKRLAKARTADRRQHYANLIQDLNLDDDLVEELFDSLEFPLLKGLSFSGGSLSAMQLGRHLQSGLHTLRYINSEIDTTILEVPAACWSQLQELNMTFPQTSNITPLQFMSFLQCLSALRRLHLNRIAENIMDEVIRWKSSSLAQLEELTLTEYRGAERSLNPRPGLRNDFLKYCNGLRKLHVDRGDWISADTLTHLSSLNSLEVLHIEEWLLTADDEFQEQYLNVGSVLHTFLSIKDLSLCGKTCVVTTLLSNKPETLVELDLTIVETDEGDDHDKILQVVGCLSSLVRLSILFDFDSVVSRTDMDHISDLSKLQKCHIESRGSSFPMEDEFRFSRHSWITDYYFKDWSAKLPRLRDLRLALDASAFTSVTHSCLQSLADNCPLLVNCQLIWEHDLSTWRSLEGPLFPCLEILHLGQVKNYGLEREQAALDKVALKNVEIIQNLAPKLNELHVESTRLNEKALMAIFKAGI